MSFEFETLGALGNFFPRCETVLKSVKLSGFVRGRHSDWHNPVQFISAHGGQMVDYATLVVLPEPQLVNLSDYTLCAGGPALMFTGLLNGCTFCMLKHGAK